MKLNRAKFSPRPLIEVFTSQDGSPLVIEREGPNGKKQLWLETVVQRADVKNRNGRVYPRAVLEREVGRFQEHIAKGTSYGAADHPKPNEVPSVLTQAVLWKEVGMADDGIVKARGIIMETHAGQQVRAILDAGGAIGTSSRGRGTVSLKADGTTKEQVEVVNEDYRLRTFDLVIDQSVEDATSRLTKYEQHLMEQEAGVRNTENETMTLTLAQLKEEHPDVYAALLDEAKKDSGTEATIQARLEALLKERENEFRERFRAEMEDAGTIIDEGKAARIGALEAFATVCIEAAKEAGLLTTEALSDDESAKTITALRTENESLKRKLAMVEAANADLAGKAQKVDVARESKKLAEGHVLADDLAEALTEACGTMDEFNAKKDAIKARFDKLAAKVATTPTPGTGRTHLNESINPPPKGKAQPEGTGKKTLTEGQKRLANLAGING